MLQVRGMSHYILLDKGIEYGLSFHPFQGEVMFNLSHTKDHSSKAHEYVNVVYSDRLN